MPRNRTDDVYETLLQVKQRRVDESSEALRLQQQRQHQAERNEQQLVHRLQEHERETNRVVQEEMARLLRKNSSAADLRRLTEWENRRKSERDQLERQRRSAHEQVLEQTRKTELARRELARARAEHKAIERYREKLQRERLRQRERKEEDEAMDLTLAKWVGKKC